MLRAASVKARRADSAEDGASIDHTDSIPEEHRMTKIPYGRKLTAVALLVAATLAGCATTPSDDSASAVRSGWFFVGGQYVEGKAGPLLERQMYVEYQIPARRTQPYPIVMIHGAAQTGTNFTGTPDGRKGWAQYFLEQGYAVYIVDQPGRGRSHYSESMGPLTRFPSSQIERRFTAHEKFNLWPQAKLHTQWPGEGPNKGQRGDPIFDQFYASQVQYIASNATTQQLNRDAGAALLDRIGPAIVMTHSQSGAIGWPIADARPQLVKAIVAAEPSGPPFANAVFSEEPARLWGVTDVPMTYDPPVSDPKQLVVVQQAQPDGPNLERCRLQGEPVRRLPNLAGVPVLILAAESSYHAAYDHCTAKYLEQAGVRNTYVRLEEVGIRGNGHMLMLEKNNLEIAAFISAWLGKNVR
jgi:pimeloyl-ACP methyl ester carboxylesterase